MIALPLVCHPSTAEPRYRAVAEIDFSRHGQWLFRYGIEGDIDQLRLPVKSSGADRGTSGPTFTDGLWGHTCFEAFVRARHSRAYHEFNFSPCGDWALYRFDDYRQGMTAVTDCPPARTVVRRDPNCLDVHVEVRPAFVDGVAPTDLQLALCAVLEDHAGKLSYWALAHPPGKPDFHHADGFLATLPSRSGEIR